MKHQRETCPKCENSYWTKDEKFSINGYGMCQNCVLSQQLGHKYTPPTYDCECGKKFVTQKRLESHMRRFDHGLPIQQVIK